METFFSESNASFLKCPFRNFKPCYEINCMAWRNYGKTCWCQLIEAYGKTSEISRQPSEMLVGDDW